MLGFEYPSRWRGRRTNVWLLAAAGLALAGCGTVSSVGDRFSQLFGSSGSSSNTQAQLVGTPPAPFAGGGASGPGTPYQDCPGVAIREGASTLQIGLKPGPVADNNEVRYQGTITRNARDCTQFGGQVNVRVGVQGRIIVGPAGAPPAVDIPIRVAVVQEGVPPKLIFSRFYKTSVAMTEGNVPFSFVAEDISYPAPRPDAQENYVFYIGFDPQGLSQRPAPAKKKGR